MKKPNEKIDRALEKPNPLKQQPTRLLFSAFPENFVITYQEEKEGGFFGGTSQKITDRIKQQYSA